MKQLDTDRLILRFYQETVSNLFIDLLSDEIVMKNVDHGVLTAAKAKALCSKLTKQMYPNGIDTIYAVFEKDSGNYIGHASIRPRPMIPEDWEINYLLTTTAWGKGFATEITKRLVCHGFTALKLSEVFATIDDENISSIKVAKKVGMSFQRHEFDEDGRFSVYSVKL